MALTSQITTSLLQVDGRMTEGGVIEIVPGARLLLDVGVENVEPGALLDEIATAVAEAQAARDEAVDISGISTSDAVIASRIETPGTATQTALSATIAAELAAAPKVADALPAYWYYPALSYVNEPSPRTYYGAAAANGDIVAGYFDHALGRHKRYVIGNVTPADDHNAACLTVKPGHRTIAAWTDHVKTNKIYVRVTDPSGDLTTLGPTQQIDVTNGVSYVQWWRDEADPNQGWMFYRVTVGASPATFYWNAARWAVDANGVFTATVKQRMISFPADNQGYLITSRKSATELHLVVSGHPWNSTTHEVYYGVFNRTTGVVTVPESATTGNVLTATGVPIAHNALQLVWSPQPGKTSILHDVRHSALPAIGVGTYDGDSLEYRHITRHESATPGMVATGTGGRAYTVSNDLGLSTVKLRAIIDPDAWYTPGVYQMIAQRYSGVGSETGDVHRCWLLRTDSTAQRIQFIWSANGTTQAGSQVSDTIDSAAVGCGVDFNPAGGTMTFYQTLDGTTWTAIGTRTFTASSVNNYNPTPLEFAGAQFTSGTLKHTVGVARKLTLYTAVGSNTELVTLDLSDPNRFPTGTASGGTGTDAQGRTWTLAGTVTTQAQGWEVTEIGGHGPSWNNLTGGLAYPNPGKGDVFVYVRNVGTLANASWELVRRSRGAGTAWVEEVVGTYDGYDLQRPRGVLNGGPYEFGYLISDHWASYFDYEGDLRLA